MNNEEWWSWEHDKALERALADGNGEDDVGRRERIAAEFPGKTAEEMKARCDLLAEDVGRIESGLIPLPHYADEAACSDDDDSGGSSRSRKRQHATRSRKEDNTKWTMEEHTAFLRGIAECGRSDWRRLSRQYVKGKTPSQVASHAQKYFLRQAMDPSKKKRQSIHDVTLETSGYSDGQSSRSSDVPPIHETDRPVNGSSAHRPPQPRAACSAPVSLRPQQLIPGTFIPLFRTSNHRRAASTSDGVPDTLARSNQVLCRPGDPRRSPASQDSVTSFPHGHCSDCPSNA